LARNNVGNGVGMATCGGGLGWAVDFENVPPPLPMAGAGEFTNLGCSVVDDDDDDGGPGLIVVAIGVAIVASSHGSAPGKYVPIVWL